MSELLGNTQTLVGTISTLAILCLFVEIRSGEKENANGNFVFQLITAIGSDVDRSLRKFANTIKRKTEDKIIEIYKRCGIIKPESMPSVESYLTKKCLENNNKELLLKFLQSYKKVDAVGRKILTYSEVNSLLNGKNKQQFISQYNNRQEPQLIALMVFLTSILFLLLDAFNFNCLFSVPFTWFFVFNLIAFSFMIWLNHFSHCYEDKKRDTNRHLVVYVLCGIISLILPPITFALSLYLPFKWMPLLAATSCPIVIVLISCVPMFYSYWKYHGYSRTIVLKHLLYFIMSSFIGVGVLFIMGLLYPEPFFNSHLYYFTQPAYARWSLLIILLLNLIFIPLYGGYLHMKIDEWKTVKRINRVISQYTKQLDNAVDELYEIVSEIMKVEPQNENLKEKSS